MEDYRIAVVGVGATGAVIAAALISKKPETVIVHLRIRDFFKFALRILLLS